MTISITSPVTVSAIDLPFPTTATLHEWQKEPEHVRTSQHGTPVVVLLRGEGLNDTSFYVYIAPNVVTLYVRDSYTGHSSWSPPFMSWLNEQMNAHPDRVHPKLREAWQRAVRVKQDEAFENDKKAALEELRAAHVAAKVEALKANDDLAYRRRLNLFSAGTAGEKAYEEAAKRAFESKQKAKRLAERVQELEKLSDEGAQIRKDFEKKAVQRVKPFSIDEGVSAAAATPPGNIFSWKTMAGSEEAHIGKPCSCGADPCVSGRTRQDVTVTYSDSHDSYDLPADGKTLVTGVKILHVTTSSTAALDLVAKKILVAEAEKVLAATKTEIGPKEHVRVVRAVVFEGTYETVQKQIAASLPVGSRGNIKGSSGCKITIAQGEIERVLPPSIPVEGY